MLWGLVRFIFVALFVAGVVVGVWHFVEQKTAQSNVKPADVTACHTFIAWDKAAHQNQVTASGTTNMVNDLSQAHDSTLKQDAQRLSDSAAANNINAVQQEVIDTAKRCNYLGLVDANGNPTMPN
jgi:hypothetical protein